MEYQINLLFLISLLFVSTAFSESIDRESIHEDSLVTIPELETREIESAFLDTENWSIGTQIGAMSIDGFSTSSIVQLMFDFQYTDNLFIEGSMGVGSVGATSYERLTPGIRLFSNNERDFVFYDFSIGYHLMMLEFLLTENRSFRGSFSVLAGMGSIDFLGDTKAKIQYGFAYSLYINEWLIIRSDVRSHIFKNDSFGTSDVLNNIQWSVGASFYF